MRSAIAFSLFYKVLAELADLTEEIARLQSLIDEAIRKRDTLQNFIDAHLALVSPVRRLPDDVVGEIFLASLPANRNPALSSDEAPLLLCWICKSWRTLAVTTPRLWASIHIAVPPPLKLQQLTEKVTRWLDRSGTVPLNISLAYSRRSDTTCDISSLMAPVVAVCRRWPDIRVVSPTLSHIVSLSADDVPVLESFAIRDNAVQVPADSGRPFFFLGTKSLRSVGCTGLHSVLGSPISWGSLTHFMTSPISYGDALRILRQCPLLETCELVFRARGPNDSPQQGSQNILLPRLRHLTISHAHILASDGPHFFDNMAVPVLRSLRCYCSGTAPRTTPLRSLVLSSVVHLGYIKLDVRRLASATLLAALADIPSLTDLHIVGEPRYQVGSERRGDPQFLAHLTLTLNEGATSALCPRLRRLVLTQMREVSDDTLLEFKLSRTGRRLGAFRASTGQDIVSLSHFRCTLQRPMDRNITPDLKNIVCVVELEYQMVRLIPYSPFEGIEGV